MKRLFTILALVLLTASLFAQSPEKMSYQAVIRNSSGVLVSNHGIGMRISILQGSPTGTLIWTETCTPNPQTNDNGLVSIKIGDVNPLSIDWSTGGPYFLKTETDPTGGTDYTISGTSQILSVPYALHAKTVASYPETDPVFAGWDKSTGISIPNTQISNWSGATSAFLTGITSGQVTTALGFTPYNSTNPSGYTSNTGTVTSIAMSAPVGLTVAGTPVTTSGTLALTLTSGYAIPTTDQLFPGFGTTADKAANGNHTHDYSGVYAALVHDHSGIYEPVIAAGTALQYWRGDKSWQTLNTDAIIEGTNLYYTDARTRAAISLTTTGNSGTATYTSGVINVPNYTLSGLGGQSALNGTGLVRMTGTSVSYDNSTYLTSFIETDPNAVLLTGNQTVAGNKTFTGTTTVPTPVNATDATNKAYVDALKQQIKVLEDNLIAAGTYILSDIEGNQYNVVKIGTQVWMKENLKTTKYSTGELIGTTTPATLDISGETAPKYQWAYAGNESNVATHGRLYTWYAVTDSRNVCPTGWHMPTDAEWTILENYLIANGYNYDGTTSGNKYAKAMASTTLWTTSTIPGAVGNTDYPAKRNATGFTAFPSGDRFYNGTFGGILIRCTWWSATESDAANAWIRSLGYGDYDVYRGSNGTKKYGLSVRCLKD
jgi:uncharacterized protein (TIGR02145 family)